jgi:CheY-like chemotaxis protein
MSENTKVSSVTKKPQRKIMLVEDDPFILDIYHIKLVEAGYQVSFAANGLEAIKKLEEGDIPQLMLLDIVMPYMDGRDVLKSMRENELWKDIPVILLTNISEKQQVEEAFKYGVKDYLIKTHFTPSEVIEKVEEVFAKMARDAQ